LKKWWWAVIPFTIFTIVVFNGLNIISLNLDDARKQDKTQVAIEIGKNLAQHNFETIISHLHFLTKSEHLSNHLNTPSNKHRRELESEFYNLEETSHLYDQIRLIDENGQEKVRVDKIDGVDENGHFRSRIIHQELLQNKGDRYYFKETAKIKNKKIYISQLDLNKENGQIERPFKPMIRFAKPVRDAQGNFKGIVILNYLGAHLLAAFQEQLKLAPGDISLLNQAGFWLSSEDASQEWGFMLLHNESFRVSNKEAWKKITSTDLGKFDIDGEAYTFSKISAIPALRELVDEPDHDLDDWGVVIVNKLWDYSFEAFVVDKKYIFSAVLIYLMGFDLFYLWAKAAVGKACAEANLRKINDNLEALVIDRTLDLSNRAKELEAIKNVVMVSMATLAETRDNEPGKHIKRTQEYVYLLAKELQKHPDFNSVLSDELIALYKRTEPLHDIGKVGIPDSILLKPGKLTETEFKIMKRTHSTGQRQLIVRLRI